MKHTALKYLILICTLVLFFKPQLCLGYIGSNERLVRTRRASQERRTHVIAPFVKSDILQPISDWYFALKSSKGYCSVGNLPNGDQVLSCASKQVPYRQFFMLYTSASNSSPIASKRGSFFSPSVTKQAFSAQQRTAADVETPFTHISLNVDARAPGASYLPNFEVLTGQEVWLVSRSSGVCGSKPYPPPNGSAVPSVGRASNRIEGFWENPTTVVSCEDSISVVRLGNESSSVTSVLQLFKPGLLPNVTLNVTQDWFWIRDMQRGKWCWFADVNGTSKVLTCDFDQPQGYFSSAPKFALLPAALPAVQLLSLVTEGPCGTSRRPVCDASPLRRSGFNYGRRSGHSRPEGFGLVSRQGAAARTSVAGDVADFADVECYLWCAHDKHPDLEFRFSLVLQTPGSGLVSGAVIGLNTWTTTPPGAPGNDPRRVPGSEPVKQCCVQATFPYLVECLMPLARVKGGGAHRGAAVERGPAMLTADPVMPQECWFSIYLASPVGQPVRTSSHEPRNGSGAASASSRAQDGDLAAPDPIPRPPENSGPRLAAAPVPIPDGSVVLLYSRGAGKYCSVSMDGSILCVSAQPSNATRNLFKLDLGLTGL